MNKKMNKNTSSLAITMCALFTMESMVPAWAGEHNYRLCNNSGSAIERLEAKGQGRVLDATALLNGANVSSNISIAADSQSLAARLAMAVGECLDLTITGQGAGLSVFRLGEGAWQAAEIIDELDASGTMANIADLQDAHLFSEARAEQERERLRQCHAAGSDDCGEIVNEVVSAEASAQALESAKKKHFEKLKKWLAPAGVVAVAGLATTLGVQVVKYRKLLRARTAGSSPDEIRELEQILNEDSSVLKKDWTTMVKEHVGPLSESDNATAQLRLPEYFSGDAPIANERPVILAKVEGASARDIKKIEVTLDGQKVPALYLPQKGMLRAELGQLPSVASKKVSLSIFGKTGLLDEQQFTLRKDGEKPEVKIVQKGKVFEVRVSDQGLGFNQLDFIGSNVKLAQSTLKFDKPTKSYEQKVKITGNPASLHVKVNKNVVVQNVKALAGGELVAGTNEQGVVNYPEERAPEATIDTELIDQALADGRRIRGKCCRDSACMFCHDDNLLDCRKKGFGHWKFNDGDPACYKIKPL